jgi:hypothetical protein
LEGTGARSYFPSNDREPEWEGEQKFGGVGHSPLLQDGPKSPSTNKCFEESGIGGGVGVVAWKSNVCS